MAKDSVEYEGKLLIIDVAQFRARLEELGAVAQPEQYFRRYVFDTIPATPSRWVRLRTDSVKSTLAVKQINSSDTDGTNEWETTVSDFETTLTILEKIGIIPRGYQENRRENYILPEGEVSIDYWPKLEPYAELEANSSENLAKLAKLFGHEVGELVGDNTEKLYADIGIDLQKTAELKFADEKEL